MKKLRFSKLNHSSVGESLIISKTCILGHCRILPLNGAEANRQTHIVKTDIPFYTYFLTPFLLICIFQILFMNLDWPKNKEMPLLSADNWFSPLAFSIWTGGKCSFSSCLWEFKHVVLGGKDKYFHCLYKISNSGIYYWYFQRP